ncbi:MAG: DUF429 domain-containing protein [Myxococcota bacterium]
MGSRRGVLGIDAAWTAGAPSGVAWLVEGEAGWRIAGCAPSYSAFCALAEGEEVAWGEKKNDSGVWPDLKTLVGAAQRIEEAEARVVAVDMPLAKGPCIARRAADNAISSAFGARGCSTHSPTPERPGELGMDLMRQLEAAGFPLAVAPASGGTKTLAHSIEVYPHPALLRLLGLDYRLPYKVSRSSQYWKGESVEARIGYLLENFARIRSGLEARLGPVPVPVPSPGEVATLSGLKRFEDALDALICAWVGLCFLEGEADSFGDADAAVWVPSAGA